VCTPWNPKDSRDIVLEIPKEFLRAAHPTTYYDIYSKKHRRYIGRAIF
jgi:hypothetical protein